VIGVSAANDGALWCVDSAGFVYKLHPQRWEWMRNPTAMHILEVTVGDENHVWCRDEEGDIYQLEGPEWNAGWIRDAGASNARSISAGADGSLWIGDWRGKLSMRISGGYLEVARAGGNVTAASIEKYKQSGGAWETNPYARDAVQVTVGDANHVWYRDQAGAVYKLQGNLWNGRWLADTGASQVQFISAAADGAVWFSSADPADKDRLFRRVGPNRWRKTARGFAIQGSLAAADTFYTVRADGRIHIRRGSDWPVVNGPDLTNRSAKKQQARKNAQLDRTT